MLTAISPPAEARTSGMCVVDASRGASITSLVSHGIELMSVGHEPARAANRDSSFVESGLVGWIDCYPSVAPEPYPGEPVGGPRIPDHGELWFRPFEVVHLAPESIRMSVAIPEASAVIEREISWIADSLEIVTRLTSTAGRPRPFVLASHPMFAADDSLWLDLPDGNLRWESAVAWPAATAAEVSDFWTASSGTRRYWADLPPAGAAKVFVPWPADGVEFGRGGMTWRMDWQDAPANGFLGLWVNRHAFPDDAPLSHWAIEPTIGSSDSLDASLSMGTASLVDAQGRAEMRLRLTPQHLESPEQDVA